MTWGRGSTRQWRELRARILRRDPECQLRFDVCTGISTNVDHILNVEAGGTDAPGNLQGVCANCHGVKTQREAAAGRAKQKRPTPRHPGLLEGDPGGRTPPRTGGHRNV